MFSPSIQSLIEEKAGSFIIPASRIAFVEDENPLYHAFLILTKMKYSKIPVLDKNQKVVGLISLAMITDKMLTPDNIVIEPLSDLKVKECNANRILKRSTLRILILRRSYIF